MTGDGHNREDGKNFRVRSLIAEELGILLGQK